MRFLLFIAKRHLLSRWRQSLMLIASVAVGVAILTTALSLTNGFTADLVGRILGTTPHIAVSDPLTGAVRDWKLAQRQLDQFPHVETVLPFVSGQALVSHGQSTAGILLRGVDPEQEQKNPDWSKYVLLGDLSGSEGAPGIMLGTELAKKLGTGVGDRLRLVTGIGRSLPVTVSGLYQSGLYEYDAHIAFVSLATAQKALQLDGAVSGLAVRLDDVFAAPDVARQMQAEVPLHIRPWTVQNRPLLQALSLEKQVIFLVILFIIIVATMGIANTLAMWVLERSREISILRAIGASGEKMGRLILLEGLLVSIAGVVLGLAAGFGLSIALETFPIIRLPSEIYYIDRLPVKMQPWDFALTAIAALLISLVAAILPARRALRLDPIEVIRRA